MVGTMSKYFKEQVPRNPLTYAQASYPVPDRYDFAGELRGLDEPDLTKHLEAGYEVAEAVRYSMVAGDPNSPTGRYAEGVQSYLKRAFGDENVTHIPAPRKMMDSAGHEYGVGVTLFLVRMPDEVNQQPFSAP